MVFLSRGHVNIISGGTTSHTNTHLSAFGQVIYVETFESEVLEKQGSRSPVDAERLL